MPRHETIRRRVKAGRKRAPGPPSDRYVLGLDDDEVEQLAQGVCPELVALKCWEMLKWQREAARNRAREWHEAADRGRRR